MRCLIYILSILLCLLLSTVRANENERLKQIVYVSHTTNPTLTHEELQDIVLTCRQLNAENDITGLLMYRGSDICQLIEGPESAIDETMEKIRRDTRHGGIIVVMNRYVEERSFRYWNIAFRNLSYTAQMNRWADEQAILTDAEEQELFDRVLQSAHQPPHRVSRAISRLINTYQRILLRMEPHQTLDNQWERINRVGCSTSLHQMRQ